MNRRTHQVLTQWLVLQCQNGNTQALEQLLKIWHPKLLRFARRACQEEAMAHDVVQESMIVVAKKVIFLSQPSAFPSWVYRIVQHKTVDFFRKHQRHAYQADTLEWCAQPDPDIAAFESSRNASAVLSQLDVPAYQLVFLYYFEQLSLAQISDILGVPEGTLKSRLYNIRQHIRCQQGEYNE